MESTTTHTEPVDWVARLADEVIEHAQRTAPGRTIVCASGLSPSGPIHLGNLREVMVPHLVADEIKRRGIACEHIISWDDYDRYRKVPAAIEGIDSWAEHIGKPLTSVPPPPGSSHPSWAAHFRAAMEESLDQLGITFRGISQTEQYTSGAYVEQVLHAMSERRFIDAILGQYRTKAAPAAGAGQGQPGQDAKGKGKPGRGKGAKEAVVSEDEAAMAALLAAEGSVADDEDGAAAGQEYFPFKPYCHRCETDFTTVTAYDDATGVLDYTCRCGHSQQMDLHTDFHGKLVWKVDWPMRWAYEGVMFEPSGVDHSSPGSSVVVGKDLVKAFDWTAPVGPMYAFVGIAGMAKMSSSKGGVPTPADALAIMEPPLLRWLYVRKRPNQAFNIAFDAEIMRMYDEWDALLRKRTTDAAQPGDHAAYERSTSVAGEGGTLRALQQTPRPLPYRALASVADITGGDEPQMLRILASMGDAGEQPLTSLDDTRPRLDKARHWVLTRMPAEDRTVVRDEPDTELLASLGEREQGWLALLAEHLEDDWSLDGLTTLVYGVPKLAAGLPVDEKQLPPEVKADQKAFFALLYRLLVTRETGPRLPTLLLCVGPQRVRKLVNH